MLSSIKTRLKIIIQGLTQSFSAAGATCYSFEAHHYVDTCAAVTIDITPWPNQTDPDIQTLQADLFCDPH